MTRPRATASSIHASNTGWQKEVTSQARRPLKNLQASSRAALLAEKLELNRFSRTSKGISRAIATWTRMD